MYQKQRTFERMIDMRRENICLLCQYAIPQKNSGLGLVDCSCKGYGNAHQTECDSFRENSRLASLKEAAIEAIKEFEHLNKDEEISKAALQRASIRSCAMQEAFAIMLDIGYDDAAEILRGCEARKIKGGTLCKNAK